MIKQFLKLLLDSILPPQHIESVSPDTFLMQTMSARREVVSVGHDWIAAPLRYRNKLVKEAVRALKYKGSTHAATLLAHTLHPLLMEYISDLQLFENNTQVLLVPIPLSKQRLRERGYNQALLLAEALVKLFPENTCNVAESILLRIKDTPPQTKTTSRKERLKNVQGCFAVRDTKAIAGKYIALIDDVTTTGATMSEARKVLLDADARDVLCLAASH